MAKLPAIRLRGGGSARRRFLRWPDRLPHGHAQGLRSPLLLITATPIAARVLSPWYREVAADNRIDAFNSPRVYVAFRDGRTSSTIPRNHFPQEFVF